jgi:hypothetical protein
MVNGTCVLPAVCPEGTTMVDGACVVDKVGGTVVCPEGTTMVNGVCLMDQEVEPEDEVKDRFITRPGPSAPPQVAGAVLPFTGPGSLSLFLLAALSLITAGLAGVRFSKK